jgi:hypothetical protein
MESIHDIPGGHTQEVTTDAVAAATATGSQTIFVADFKCKVTGVSFTGDAAVTGGTDTKNLNVIDKGSDGSGSDEIGNLDLATGTNLVAFDEQAITITETDLEVGDVLALEVEKVNSGADLPRGVVKVTYEGR